MSTLEPKTCNQPSPEFPLHDSKKINFDELNASLLKSSESGNYGRIIKVLKASVIDGKCKININIRNDLGETPLHKAAQKGHILIMQTLLKYGANSQAITYSNETPMHYALKYNQSNAVKCLIPYYVFKDFIDPLKSTKKPEKIYIKTNEDEKECQDKKSTRKITLMVPNPKEIDDLIKAGMDPTIIFQHIENKIAEYQSMGIIAKVEIHYTETLEKLKKYSKTV